MPSLATKTSLSSTVDPIGAITLADPQEDTKSTSSSESVESSTSSQPRSETETGAKPKKGLFGKIKFGKKKKKNKDSERE